MQELAPSLYTLSMAHILEVYSKSVTWRRKIHRKVERRGKYTWIVSRSLSPCPWSKETGHIQSAKLSCGHIDASQKSTRHGAGSKSAVPSNGIHRVWKVISNENHWWIRIISNQSASATIEFFMPVPVIPS